MEFFRNLFSILFPPRKTEQIVRDVALEEVRTLVSPQTTNIGNTEVTALLPYRQKFVHALIVEAKFFKNAKAIEILGTLLAEYIQEHIDPSTAYIVPIPLGPKRRQKRGYNQIEELAFSAEKQIPQITVRPECLVRVKDTVRQTSLKKQDRLQNMKDAFVSPAPLDPAYLYIVLDDVLTTGATLAGGINALAKVGATRIKGIALAYSGLK